MILPMFLFLAIPTVKADVTFQDIKLSWTGSVSGSYYDITSQYVPIDWNNEYIFVKLPNEFNSLQAETVIILYSESLTISDTVIFYNLDSHVGNGQIFYSIYESDFPNYQVSSDWMVKITVRYPNNLPGLGSLNLCLQQTRSKFLMYYPTTLSETQGYSEGLTIGRAEGYLQGRLDGISETYQSAFQDGADSMYAELYDSRYAEGLEAGGNGTLALVNFIPGVMGSVFAFFFQVASIEFMGISPLEVIAAFASIAATLFVFKVFLSK